MNKLPVTRTTNDLAASIGDFRTYRAQVTEANVQAITQMAAALQKMANRLFGEVGELNAGIALSREVGEEEAAERLAAIKANVEAAIAGINGLGTALSLKLANSRKF